MPAALPVVFALYPDITQLDFTAPLEVLARLPGAAVRLASVAGGELGASGGLTFAHLERLDAVRECALLCVPGGFGTAQAMADEAYLGHVARLAAQSHYVTSVCTGSLVLGAAGLLKGKRAATHWAWRDLLVPFGATPDPGRVVRDGNVITGGGVTAGIDFALDVVAELAGAETAQAIQLQIEYAPAPPFNAGSPETAPPAILARVRERNANFAAARRGAVEAAAARLAGN